MKSAEFQSSKKKKLEYFVNPNHVHLNKAMVLAIFAFSRKTRNIFRIDSYIS